jgi:phosphoglycerate dehydrogenase-like enzyme
VTKEAIDRPLTIVIGAPFEPELAQRIEAAMPGRLRVLHEPDLLPVPRYVADHHGIPRALTPAQRLRWLDILAEAEVMLDFDWLDPANLPKNAPRLRWVQGTSAGIGEFLSNTGLIKSDITFTTAAGVHAGALAEFTILGLLYFFREVPRLLGMQKAHQWERYTNREMAGSRLMLVGLGAVGREVARRCAAMGIEVWGARRRSGEAAPEGISRLIPLAELRRHLPQVDALVLACPLTEQTRGLIGVAEIAALKPSAIIVNIARGAVIDEPAMIDALAGGRLAGAALDVFTTEPLPPDSPLWDMPNILFCPHSASTVMAENERIVEIFVDNLRRFTEGQPLRNLFDKQRGY